jgi:hypothetical protein
LSKVPNVAFHKGLTVGVLRRTPAESWSPSRRCYVWITPLQFVDTASGLPLITGHFTSISDAVSVLLDCGYRRADTSAG